jgi:hypothetical protein
LALGLEDATRIINGVNHVAVKPKDETAYSPLRIVPQYPDLPMEEVFSRTTRFTAPGVYLREFERARVVYFPSDVDRTFWDVLNADHGKLLRNAVLWATNEPAAIEVKGPGVLDLAVWQQQKSMTVHLVNLTNPMMMKGPVREIIPLPAQQVSVRIPRDRSVTKAHLLVAGREVPYGQRGGGIELEVPSISVHEVIALDFAG